MGGEGLAFPRAPEVRRPQRLQGVRIHPVWQAILLGGVEGARESHGGGVRRRAPLRVVRVAHARIVSERVAVIAVELPARRTLPLEPFGADVAALVVDDAVFEPEHGHVAVGGQGDVVGRVGRIKPVGMQPVECSVELGGDLAGHFAVVDVGLEAGGREVARHRRQRGKIGHGASSRRRNFGQPGSGCPA